MNASACNDLHRVLPTFQSSTATERCRLSIHVPTCIDAISTKPYLTEKIVLNHLHRERSIFRPISSDIVLSFSFCQLFIILQSVLLPCLWHRLQCVPAIMATIFNWLFSLSLRLYSFFYIFLLMLLFLLCLSFRILWSSWLLPSNIP